MQYADLLASKMPAAESVGREPKPVHESLFGFQKALTEWAIRKGRAALFADTGLGKTRMQLSWAKQMDAPTLIVAPLAVAEQTIEEALALDMEVEFVSEQRNRKRGIFITNYEKLHRFDPSKWQSIVLDESSILKSIDGKTRTKLIREWSSIPYRLCCTATPAPNDIAE